MASPSKRQKIENLNDHLTAAHESVDSHLICGIYHASKKEHEETVKELEKCRRLLNANRQKSTFLINDMRMQYNAALQENGTLTSRNTFLFRENSSLKDRIKTLKQKVTNLNTLLGETLDESLSDDLFSSQESVSTSHVTTASQQTSITTVAASSQGSITSQASVGDNSSSADVSHDNASQPSTSGTTVKTGDIKE